MKIERSHRSTAAMLAALLAGVFFPACGGGSSSGGGAVPSGLHINEVMASNTTTCADEAGEYDDWIELFNSADKPIDLKGLAITDDANVPLKFVFGTSLTVPAGGFLVLWADKQVGQGSNHLPFKLGADGEQVLLNTGDGQLIDEADWSGAVANVSLARLPDGTGPFVQCGSPTCGETNPASCAPAPDAGAQ